LVTQNDERTPYFWQSGFAISCPDLGVKHFYLVLDGNTSRWGRLCDIGGYWTKEVKAIGVVEVKWGLGSIYVLLLLMSVVHEKIGQKFDENHWAGTIRRSVMSHFFIVTF